MQLSNGIWPLADWKRPKSALFHYSRCIWMAINEHFSWCSINGEWTRCTPPNDNPYEETIQPQKPNLTCTADPQRQWLIGRHLLWTMLVGIVYGKVTGYIYKLMEVLRAMDSINSILVCIWLTSCSIIQPPNDKVADATSEWWTARLQERLINLSSKHLKTPFWYRFPAWRQLFEDHFHIVST